MKVKTGIRGEGSQQVETDSILREPDLKEVIQVASKGAPSADDGAHDAQRCSDLGEHQNLPEPAGSLGLAPHTWSDCLCRLEMP